jgi:hypothetical protein
MGQGHNLHPSLFGASKYQVAPKAPAAAPEVDPDDAFIAKMTAAEDRGTHLTMFAQAKTLAGSHSAERSHYEAPKDFQMRKLQESRREQPTGSGIPVSSGANSTYESIQKYGVQTPVLVSQSDNFDGSPAYTLHHGHHRVYTSNKIDPEREIPLVHRMQGRGQGDPMASLISMGGDYIGEQFKGWTDPTVTPRDY